MSSVLETIVTKKYKNWKLSLVTNLQTRIYSSEDGGRTRLHEWLHNDLLRFGHSTMYPRFPVDFYFVLRFCCAFRNST